MPDEGYEPQAGRQKEEEAAAAVVSVWKREGRRGSRSVLGVGWRWAFDLRAESPLDHYRESYDWYRLLINNAR